MREIKFRAWDKSRKEVVKIVPNNLNEYFFSGEKICELMQYTGLKDKNGVEIYEGDVVKVHSFEPQTYQIEFIEGGFCATRPELKGFPIDINMLYPSTGAQGEVIGNIYQNPELLAK